MTTSFFEAALLPDQAKRAMCLELLEEFGASIQRISDTKGEISHGCLVSPGAHSDQSKNPTASLNYQKLTYKCLGCGASGGLLWFIATCRGGTSLEARSWLEQTAGLGGSVMELDAMLRFLDQMYAVRSRTPIPTYSDRILAPWVRVLHPYLTDPYADGGREIPVETARRFRLGWDPEQDRVVLPHFWQGQLVGWQTRKMPTEYLSAMPSGEVLPKYLSSPDFPKDSTIFNHDPAEPEVVVVESMLSVLRHTHRLHLEATFGASVTEGQIRRLTKHPKIVLWMDNDRAGWRAVEGSPAVAKTRTTEAKEAVPGLAEQLSRYCSVRVVDSPWQQDAGELPTETVAEMVAAAVSWDIWQRPKVIYCYKCCRTAHQGPC